MIPDIKKAFQQLAKENDIIVIEGAGSPAEINLRENDIVNMGMAEMVNAPVLLVGDIDRGGVFAQLLGTLMLLTEDEKKRVKGLIVNKFRGDKTILDPGIVMLEEKGEKPVVGVVPYMEIDVEDEDSLTGRFDKKEVKLVDIAVIHYPRISNFTDLAVFEHQKGVSVRYVTKASELENTDMIVLPGSKNTMGDLMWMRQNGMEAAIKKYQGKKLIFGICGGYQMLGEWIEDPHGVEEGGRLRGMELLPVHTILTTNKVRTQVKGRFLSMEGFLQPLSGKEIEGYEIHMGETRQTRHVKQIAEIQGFRQIASKTDGAQENMVYGTYVHGIFDHADIATTIIKLLAERKGVTLEDLETQDYESYRDKQYDLLADTLRAHLDMKAVYQILNYED